MEVMNNDVFSQTETLVGQAGKTRSMGVSDDPMLMSMLSTGFYANPLRTMIQEVMFNAWDAHKMGNCQDKPIDIYINDVSGLIIRDYGPGISDEDMVPVYCIYGNSTKRKDKSQTGGFGLGCKSPFSYTESFTVTSMHNDIKSMYLVSRVSDDAEGKPGLTPLVTVPTDETGLMVAIPLESNHKQQAVQHIHNVLYLSGIKANIHVDEDDVIEVDSKSVSSGEYVIDYSSQNDSQHFLYAVYGGVRYRIPKEEEYIEEYKFMKILAFQSSALYIGFAPDTLTPLPNREGLNMSSKTKENIKIGLEICMEKFKETFEPLVHAYFRKRFDDYLSNNVQPQFALFHSLGVMHNNDTNFLNDFQKEIEPLVPLNVESKVLKIAVRLIVNQIKSIADVIGHKRWLSILVQHFIRVYPNHKQLGFNTLKQETNDILYNYQSDDVEELIASWTQPAQIKKLYNFEQELSKILIQDKLFKKPVMRLNDGSKYVEVVRHKNAGKSKDKYFGPRADNIPLVSHESQDRIWNSKNSIEVRQMFMTDVVIIAKTVSCLNETSFMRSDFSKDSRNYHGLYNTEQSKYYRDENSSGYDIAPAYVIHSRKGGYDKALNLLKSMGYKVIEADEPEKKVYVTKEKKPVNQFNRVDLNNHNWASYLVDDKADDYDPKEDGIPLTNPTHFLYATTSSIQSNNHYNRELPTKTLVSQMLNKYPDIVMVHTQSQADSMTKKDIKPFSDCVQNWFNSLNSKVYRIRNLVRIFKILNDSSIPKIMLTNSDIQSVMGISKIKPDDFSFWDDLSIINTLYSEYYNPVNSIKQELKNLINSVWLSDPSRSKVSNAIESSNVFYENKLISKYKSYDLNNQNHLCKNIARYIRAMS